MATINWDEIYETALDWTKEAREYILVKMKESFQISTKADQDDLVTDVDKGVENFFQEKLAAAFPDHRLMGEEGSAQAVKDLTGVVWILDPIDGTMNFVHQERFFAISLGIFQEGEGMIGIVYDVMGDELFTSRKGRGAFLNGAPLPRLIESPLNEAILSINAGWIINDRRLEELVRKARGIRTYGSAALEIAYVAAGRLDAYISHNLAPWDIAGGSVILKEVGGIMTNDKGSELTFLEKDTFLAAKPSIYQDVLSIINK
ncbi:myo-inositol-1(or 4)-monophosphatase [Evansella caseinilytica]|uniref:inositol-phosphate phosphatase n=1 Tax=Evansella caseinilytica TaxID=1503961 RepID=A0A1H3MN68_9BACI|nr:inositol monophosphatase family protein [Evansella caseinilytica]SDY77933.1 myo-inositol-1(or 4)-monophosphatase [Evansella caseinilytica]